MSKETRLVTSPLGFACLLFLCCSGIPGFSQTHKPLCSKGNNGFSAILSGVARVEVGPPKSGGLAQRTCQAVLAWRDEELVVAQDVAEVDLDLFGTDLEGVGPVAAFQVKGSAEQCCRNYLLYSLTGGPQRIRTIEGGFFKAKDHNLDGRIEIWAEDAASINNFDGLPAMDIQFPPTLVLSFEKGQLLDATSEFTAYFDSVVGTVRAQMDPAAQEAFKQSNGTPRFSVNDLSRFTAMQRVKIQILEIVWAYLYSGREQQAWAALAEMWPASDIARIQPMIVNAREKGILAQVDGQTIPRKWRQKTQVFAHSQVKKARPIMMWAPHLTPTLSRRLSRWDIELLLVIDSAGKVYSAELTDKKLALDKDFRALLETAKQWKFIPATRNDRSVASEMETTITLQR